MGRKGGSDFSDNRGGIQGRRDQEVQLRVLEREAKAQRELFESYLAKYRETAARVRAIRRHR